MLELLRPEISNNVEFNASDSFHVTNVIRICLDYSGGLEELVRIMKFYEKDSKPMVELSTFLESFPIET